MDFLANLNARRILVAESNPDNMDRLADVLEEAGYNVHKAYYAGDAIYALTHNDYDLALIDGLMHDRGTPALADQMRQFGALRWVALVDDAADDPHSTLRQGAAAYLPRSVPGDALLHRLERVLRGDTMPSSPPAPPDRRQPPDVSTTLERRLVEQQALSTLARSLSAVLDLDVLLTQVVDAAVRLSNAEEGMLLLPDDEAQALYIRAVKGIDSETARNFRIKTQDTLAGQVFKTGKPVLVGDQGWQKLKTEYLVKSLLYVPLSIKGEPIGVLGVNNKLTDRTFTEHDGELLQDLAAHAAIAIENARLYGESELRTRELSTLVEAGEAANSTLALDRVLSIIASQLIKALSVAQCYVGEWDAERQRLVTLALSHRALWKGTEGPPLLPVSRTTVEKAFKQKRMVVFGPAPGEDLPPQAAWLPHCYHAQSVVHVPLFTQERPLGIVTLYRVHEPYSSDDFPHAADVQLQQLGLEALVMLTASTPAAHWAELSRLAGRMLAVIQADWVEIALWQPASHDFRLALSFGEAIWREAPRPVLRLGEIPHLSEALASQITFSGQLSGEMAYLRELVNGKSVLGVPLVIKGETTGLVVLTDTLQTRQFSRREIELAQALVLQAANALDNARLFRDLELSLEELHRTQSKLVQTARLSAMGELAAAVAHQINNPLTTILGDAELIIQDLVPDDPNVEGLEAILRAGKRAHEVVRRLLAMARQHTPDDVLEALDINATIENTLMLVKSHIQQGNVSITVQLAPELPPSQGIRGELEDVWLNLLLNARDAVANRADAQIGIRTQHLAEDDMIEAIVWDNGIGIPEEQQADIFEPFFTTKPSGEGTGLGLHICRQIVEKCQGSIQVQSAYNQGTQFTILLPVYHRRETA